MLLLQNLFQGGHDPPILEVPSVGIQQPVNIEFVDLAKMRDQNLASCRELRLSSLLPLCKLNEYSLRGIHQCFAFSLRQGCGDQLQVLALNPLRLQRCGWRSRIERRV